MCSHLQHGNSTNMLNATAHRHQGKKQLVSSNKAEHGRHTAWISAAMWCRRTRPRKSSLARKSLPSTSTPPPLAGCICTHSWSQVHTVSNHTDTCCACFVWGHTQHDCALDTAKESDLCRLQISLPYSVWWKGKWHLLQASCFFGLWGDRKTLHIGCRKCTCTVQK